MATTASSAAEPLLVLYSKLAFYPIHWLALRELAERYTVRVVALSGRSPELSAVHRALGDIDTDTGDIEFRTAPDASRATRIRWVRNQFVNLRPDLVWLQEEPTDPFVLEILMLHLRNRRPRIICAVCENVFDPLVWPLNGARRRVWSRLDALLAVATPSLNGIKRAGMPDSVPSEVLVAGALSPPSEVTPDIELGLRAEPADFVVGFAGNLTDQKGWHILTDAVCLLPDNFKLAIAGDGPQRNAVEARLAKPDLAYRSTYVGLLPKERLWSFYQGLDVLTMPSLTQPRLVEQFGGVLADGMAMGLPLVGSSSGAIPEVMGEAGIVVPEGDPKALANAFERLAKDDLLRTQLTQNGPPRFAREFSIPAYADKIAVALHLERRREPGVAFRA